MLRRKTAGYDSGRPGTPMRTDRAGRAAPGPIGTPYAGSMPSAGAGSWLLSGHVRAMNIILP